MIKVFTKVISFLDDKERKSALYLLILILVMAIVDVIGIASIMPFIAVLTNPELVVTNNILKKLYLTSSFLGIKTTEHFLFILGVVVFFLLVFSIAVKAFTTYMQVTFIQMREYTISKRLLKSYIYHPYSWFLNRHSADLGKTILSEVNVVVNNGIKPILDIITQGVVTISILILLFVANPLLALVVSITLISAYGVIYKFSRHFLNQIGKQRVKSNELRFKNLNDTFGAIKEIKLGGLERNYIDQFDKPAKKYAQNQAFAHVISGVPGFGIEAIAFGGIMIVILYQMYKFGTFIEALPLLALYVFAGYRLMPALQLIYNGLTRIRFIEPAINALHQDIRNYSSSSIPTNKNKLPLTKSVSLNNVTFGYSKTSKNAIKDISIEIPVYSTVGLVGRTGSGKTTLVDIIIGLLKPKRGQLKVDNKTLNKLNLRRWQNSIGYVSQNFFLTDGSIAENIAFGKKIEDIDHKAVIQAAKIANIHDFIMHELPKQYQTKIGEQGLKLSGGQRQRIGIARAIYLKPQMLIFDEATSALDNFTEKAVMSAIDNLKNNITIILIAHRIQTLKKCDMIFVLEHGELKGIGNYDDLIRDNKYFQKIAPTNN